MRLFLKVLLFTLLILLTKYSFSFTSVAVTKVTTSLSTANSSASQSAKFDDQTLANFVEKYQIAIEEIESQDGAYGSRLTQELMNLGSIYQEYGRHDEAIKFLKRSAHLNRINDGLYSTTQIPIIRKLITSLKEKKQWPKVHKSYSYLSWLYSQNFTTDDIEMLEIQMEKAHWYLKSYSVQLSAAPLRDLINAYGSYQNVLELMTNTYSKTDIRVIPALNGLILVNYLVATAALAESVTINSDGSYAKEHSISGRKISFMKRKSFSTGVELIQRELAVHNEQQPKDHINISKAMLKLADWYLMYGKMQLASSHYKQAYAYAKRHNNNKFNELFNVPVVLPELPNIYNNSTTTNLPNYSHLEDVKYVHASMDITRYGKVQNLKIVSSYPKNNMGMRSRVLKSLRAARFRPRIADGSLMFTAQFQIHVFP
ncbi:MAG: tetratricopeptide repeat protein [Colwellia sp.]|nr:tetratricopeptide repeat protein [Colwellia sp.]